MEFFNRAKVFRLKCGHQRKYLIADPDEETVRQSSVTLSTNARWAVEVIEGKSNVIRLRSCHSWKYLATSEEPFLLGMTGKKVVQRLRLDPSVEWEPIKEGPYIKLKSHAGTFLRANRGLPPWRNTITHDPPGNWTSSENLILWIVDIVELDYKSSGAVANADYGLSEVTKHPVDVQSSSSKEGSQKSASSTSSSVSTEDQSYGRKVSDSASNLKSTVDGSEEKSGVDGSSAKSVSRFPSIESSTDLGVNVAKLTLKELKNMDFEAVLSSGQIKKLERAVSVIAADAKLSGGGKNSNEHSHLQEKLKAMKTDHDLACKELIDYTAFSSRRYEMRAELKKDAAKARELETLDAELSNRLETTKAKRDELLKQIAETENNIKNAEIAQIDCGVEIEKLTISIEQKSDIIRDIKRKDKSWQVRKYEAERTLERVQEDWVKAKDILAGFW